ncbi:pyrimidine reductase family protein [Nocardia seriolae]|nr:pyrimidine reductase family protein [Nocardia seriolae]APA99868.1 5-amino-6-(5-phosphoribosylamino)uracil reductase [Nocardia seriolae]MTJ64561.1 pyrimidine reductase family protein [Nocardia seriolae]MTJ73373.1 pyrimidine reductase family protein [Nocardia seriolae]MTJ89404.1 pyrimidine reductase family protein [Nocardia seriolae]MTK33380.1 pyrimidine reductase family protein [Nocardia seriolae]
MQHVPNAIQLTDLTRDDLVELYAYPVEPKVPYVRFNFVTSIDGAVSVDGRSGGLGTPADKKVFALLRDLSDVVLVGAGTARAEHYGAAHTDSELRRRLCREGCGGDADGTPPRIAVVTARAALDPGSKLFTDRGARPLVLTTAAASGENKKRLADAGAEVIEVGENRCAAAGIRTRLDALGLRRVLCEGGPSLFGEFLTAGAVDELCLTVSPQLVGGSAGRIAVSPMAAPSPMRPRHLLLDTDGTILTRWERAHTRG